MKKVLVTGAAGQLGQCFREQAEKFPQLDITYVTSDSFDITLYVVISTYLRENGFDYCINCAAYTNVEKAETHRELAFRVNADGTENLAKACAENGISLIHFSTDYVFDGEKSTRYSEEDETNPINAYGASKLAGEESIQREMEEYFIFRTSWLYSDKGHNFFKTIQRRAEEGEDLYITTAQKGSPTNAHDLAKFVLQLIADGSEAYGVYHYSNLGEATWYEFAEEILRLGGQLDKVHLQAGNTYVTLARRPSNSVMSKDKVLSTFGQNIPHWKESLAGLCGV